MELRLAEFTNSDEVEMKKLNSGISLIETMIALLVLSMAGAVIILLTIQILAANNNAKLRNRAAVLAEQSIEQVRDYYQNNKYASLAGNGSLAGRCYRDGTLVGEIPCTPTGYLSCYPTSCVAVETFFRRQVKLVNEGSRVKATVVIWWLDKGDQRDVTLETYFYNY